MLPSWYERHILPTVLDLACGMPMISRMRQLV
ncbi:MAG: SAM-dependent methyltransferase, partial [Chitinophagaceae bacterium]|nr:SAM-dependent methyltransferase [Polaromonas sp.]